MQCKREVGAKRYVEREERIIFWGRGEVSAKAERGNFRNLVLRNDQVARG